MVQTHDDNRIEQLEHWLSKSFGRTIGPVLPASEDASFRRYFRIFDNGNSYIVMDSPIEHENPVAFVRIAKRLHEVGLNVPIVYDQELEQGFLLLSDLGSTDYLQVLSKNENPQMYRDAIDALVRLQTAGMTEPDFLPPYNETLLRREMELFRQWYLPKHLGIQATAGEHAMIDEAFDFLTVKALEQPKVWVHLDFHSRNLMYVKDNNPGILDFQDAVCGPITYDLVSLLRDCYICWPSEFVEEWMQYYIRTAQSFGLPLDVGVNQFKQWFDLMGIQRHLKVLGIFSRLYYRDNKPRYLDDLPLVLDYFLKISDDYPELQELRSFVARVAT